MDCGPCTIYGSFYPGQKQVYNSKAKDVGLVHNEFFSAIQAIINKIPPTLD